MFGIIATGRVIYDSGYESRCQSVQGSLTGNIEELTRIKNGVETKRYYVNYVYEVNGVEYRGSDDVPDSPPPSNCTVYYLPDDPSNSRLYHPDIGLGKIFAGAAWGLGILFLVIGIVSHIKANREQKDMAAEREARRAEAPKKKSRKIKRGSRN